MQKRLPFFLPTCSAFADLDSLHYVGNVPGTTETQGVDSERGQQTADNIRYGQNISESGMGGKTNTATGTANQEGGYGGTEAQRELEQGDNSRTAQQYSAKEGTHDYKVGA